MNSPAQLLFVNPDLSDDERRTLLYDGAVILYTAVGAVQRLVDHAQTRLRQLFGDVDPERAHLAFSPDQMADLLVTFKPRFINDQRSKELVVEICTELGCDPLTTYFDPPRLRTSFPSDHLTAGIAYAFDWHRDTWYSAPPCQINWWLPIFPLLAGNGMDILPSAFGAAVPNDSTDFNYYVHNAWRGKIRDASNARDVRTHPRVTGEVPAGWALRLQPPVGGMFLFCGDHLHASVFNTTDVTRYSIDFRTVQCEDVRSHRGGPAIDVACRGTNLRDFTSNADQRRLDPQLIAMYDPSDAAEGEVLLFEPDLDD